MITLSDERGIVEIKSWDDVTSRPGFRDNLNPVEHELASILGRYVFPEPVVCGLSICRTPHKKGYIALTKDGCETNIGKDCGKKHFGVDFDTASKQFEKAVTLFRNRERLTQFSFQIDEISEKISTLRQHAGGADWVHTTSRPLVLPNRGCPDDVIRRIGKMNKVGSSRLMKEREATEDEIATREAQANRKLPRPVIVEEPIADISGLDALRNENDLREILVVDLEQGIKSFRDVDIDTLQDKDLREWVRWVDQVENKLERAVTAVELGHRLLSKENLEPFLQVLNTGAERMQFRGFLNTLTGKTS